MDGTYVRIGFAVSSQNCREAVLIGNTTIRSVRCVDSFDTVSKPQLVVYAAAVLSVALIGARYLQSVSAEATTTAVVAGPSGVTGSSGSLQRAGSLVVHVAGAVREPGVVRLESDDRVADAIDAAGGWSAGADRAGVNLAARVVDGQQVVVPRKLAGGQGASGVAGPISLSSATVQQLDELDGIGPGLAQKIVDFRTQNGGFSSVDQLGEVPGIGDKRLESLRSQLQP